MISSISPTRFFQPIALMTKRIEERIAWIFKQALQPLAGYFLKICLFRESALQGRVSRWIFSPLSRFIVNLYMRLRHIPDRMEAFNPIRLTRSAAFLSEFAEVRFLRTKDNVLIPWAHYSPEKFDQWVLENGGVRDGEWIRPRTENDWKQLQRLRQFKAFEEIHHAFRIPGQKPLSESRFVLRCQGFGRYMPMDKTLIGLHLAAGFHYALFDWRTEISAEGFFEDAEAVYQSLLQEGISPHQITAMGSCRATFVVSRLKELHHQEGLNTVMIHAPSSLRSAILQTPWPANQIGLIGLPIIEKKGGEFDTLRRLESLPLSDAATCLIMSEEDETLPQNTLPDLKKACEQCGPTTVVLVPRDGPGDPHFQEPLKNPLVLEQYFNFLARPNRSGPA